MVISSSLICLKAASFGWENRLNYFNIFISLLCDTVEVLFSVVVISEYVFSILVISHTIATLILVCLYTLYVCSTSYFIIITNDYYYVAIMLYVVLLIYVLFILFFYYYNNNIIIIINFCDRRQE